MKNILFATVLLITTFSFAQSNQNKEFETIVENLFEDVFSKLDSTKMVNYLTHDFILLENGEVFDYSAVEKMVQNLIVQFKNDANKNNKFERINRFEFLNSYVDGNIGWMYYKNFAEFKMNDAKIASIQWLESANFVKTNDGWKIAFLHSTVVKENEN